MFEFLFKYPPTVFAKGTLVFLGEWPIWTLIALLAVAAGGLGWVIWRRRRSIASTIRGPRTAVVWLLQSLLVCLLLVLLWQPALSIATLRPQQNIVAVVIDDSKSMAAQEDGQSRKDQVLKTLNDGLLKSLRAKFQVRLYRLGDHLERIDNLNQLNASAPATHIGDGLKEVLADSATLPIGAVVLLSDGADNTGGVDLETISDIKRQRIPINTVGFGRERMAHDIEVTDVQLPARSLAKSRLNAQVSFHQWGMKGAKARLAVRDGGAILASRDVVLAADGTTQTESVLFNAGDAGVKNLQFSIDVLPEEENKNNNALTRVLYVDNAKPRVVYMEGEPRWDYKFLRRAVEDDKNLDLYSVVRTTQNKLYVQVPPDAPKGELKDGFPTKVEDLFAFQGIILGSVEANYFTAAQQEMIQQFVDRRGGGLLFLGGRSSLADGGYDKPPFSDLLPVKLPDHKNTFHIEPASPRLTPAGRDSLITRIEDSPDANVERWKKLPYLMNFQEAGQPKPGALVLAEMTVMGGKPLPLLITEKYGRGRTAVFATGGDWRWQMLQPVQDMSHEIFWRQLLRWLVSDSPTRVVTTTTRPVLYDDGHVHLRAEVRDTTYLPTSDAQVQAHILGPDGNSQTIDLRPDSVEQGVYTADWDAAKPGSYVSEVVAQRGQQELGRGVVTFRREDGVAENFHLEQNRDLLQKLSSETGGRYYQPDQVSRLGEEISYSDAGITVRETKDLWDMPAVFFLVLLLCCGEWLLRRKWGVV
ncbi:MAG TPA: glutamine amidotransferase [Bryobacteraceae bacterium]|nr:glutamine amidotransferase [Bryobacteraceae bacterium]